MSQKSRLSECEAASRFYQIIRDEMDAWHISFIQREENLVIDEGSPIVSDSWNVRLFCPEVLSKIHDWMPDDADVIGFFGESETAWVCRLPDGRIVEVDEYDGCITQDALRHAYPSVAHYLLSIVDG